MTMLSTATRLIPLPIVFALLFAPLQTASDTAYACSCIQTTVEERVQAADVVAIGTLVSLYEDRTTVFLTDGETEIYDMDGFFAIDTYYKDPGPSEIAVDDPFGGGTCGFVSSVSLGQEAILFLTLSDGEYLTGICAGSHFISGDQDSRAETIAAIEAVTGPGQAPEASQAPEVSPPQEEPESPEDEHTESTPWAVILPIAFAIPLAVLFIPAILRRRGGH